MPVVKRTVIVRTVTYQLTYKAVDYWAVFDVATRMWFLRSGEAIVYSYLEEEGRNATMSRANNVLNLYLDIEKL